jgi:hypothetical protein
VAFALLFFCFYAVAFSLYAVNAFFFHAINQADRPSIYNVKFCWSRAFSGFSSNVLL